MLCTPLPAATKTLSAPSLGVMLSAALFVPQCGLGLFGGPVECSEDVLGFALRSEVGLTVLNVVLGDSLSEC